MTTRLSDHIRGVLKRLVSLLPGAMRGLRFDRRVGVLLTDRDDLAPIRPTMLAAWRQSRKQIAKFDTEVLASREKDPTRRLLMSVLGLGVVSVLAYVSTVGDLARCGRYQSVAAQMGLKLRQYQSGAVGRCGVWPYARRTLIHDRERAPVRMAIMAPGSTDPCCRPRCSGRKPDE